MSWRKAALFLALAACAFAAVAQTWTPLGPPGGDVRSLAVAPSDPRVVYLGTAHGVLYRSEDGGQRWQRLQPGFPREGMSLDEIVVTPAGDVLVGYWRVSGAGGGVARSADGGKTFTVLAGIEGESVHALAAQPAEPERLVAGTLSGVFASSDGGASWRRLSPAGHPELRNVESVAFDPLDPDTVYAGTWHLVWKTNDGGRSWRVIPDGMVTDSDVFTLTPDVRAARTVYATACTGIYRSQDAGARWSKLQGIPASSRRTRAFAQDPARPERLYAGTTQGLWASEDAGASWSLRTSPTLVVNAIVVLPGGDVLIGCDGAGALRSADAGRTWRDANEGFSARFVSRLVVDAERNRFLAAILDDRFHAGVLAASRLSGPWERLAPGLEGREVVSLALGGGDVLAGTDDGLFALRAGEPEWRRVPLVVRGLERHARVAEVLAVSTRVCLAATDGGLLRTGDGGATWEVVPLGAAHAVYALARTPAGDLLAATPLGLYRGDAAGFGFRFLSPGPADVRVGRFAFSSDARLVFASTSGGLFRSRDGGMYWTRCRALGGVDVTGLALDANGRTVYAADFMQGGLFRSDDAGDSWTALPTDGLSPSRVWSVALGALGPGSVVAATASGGLHVWLPEKAAPSLAPAESTRPRRP